MQTWLLILRGDPAEGGTPIGVVTDGEICLAAVRAAWAAFQQLYAEDRRDPALREGLDGMDRRLRAAAVALEHDVGAPTLAPAARTLQRHFGTPPGQLICERRECGKPFTPPERQRGSEQKYCSRRCCRLASEARCAARAQPENPAMGARGLELVGQGSGAEGAR